MKPEEQEKTTCPACGAKVVVATRDSDRARLLLCPTPHPEGAWVFGAHGHLYPWQDREPGRQRFREHSEVCPQVDMFGPPRGQEGKTRQ